MVAKVRTHPSKALATPTTPSPLLLTTRAPRNGRRQAAAELSHEDNRVGQLGSVDAPRSCSAPTKEVRWSSRSSTPPRAGSSPIRDADSAFLENALRARSKRLRPWCGRPPRAWTHQAVALVLRPVVAFANRSQGDRRCTAKPGSDHDVGSAGRQSKVTTRGEGDDTRSRTHVWEPRV